jgi:hypothetical protein
MRPKAEFAIFGDETGASTDKFDTTRGNHTLTDLLCLRLRLLRMRIMHMAHLYDFIMANKESQLLAPLPKKTIFFVFD